MNNKYMGVMSAPSQRTVAIPAPHHQMISQQRLGMLNSTSLIAKAEKNEGQKKEMMVKVAQEKRQQEIVELKKNANQLKQGMKEVGSASFKIAQIGTKSAGEKWGPGIRQGLADFK